MQISVITLFPNMITSFINESIVKRAVDRKIVSINLVNLRQFAADSYGTVDDRPYGGGTGMVMKVDVLAKAVRSVPTGRVVYTTPRGKKFDQNAARRYSALDNLILLAGHYEGIDERTSTFINEEVSVGDFIMTGGEIAVAAIVDATVRLLPGVLKKEDATIGETFGEIEADEIRAIVGNDPILEVLIKSGRKKIQLLEYPQYTRPADFEGQSVPEVMTSGDPKKIREWQIRESWELTKKRRPDLLGIPL